MQSRISCFALALVVGLGCGGGTKQSTTPEPVTDDSPHVSSTPALDDEPDDGMQVEGLLGSIDPSAVQPVIERKFSAITDCYDAGSGALRFIGGRVELKFRIATDGTVRRVQVSDANLGAWPIEKCVLAVARRMQFPRPRGGEAEIRFPIEFPGRGSVVDVDEDRAEAELGTVYEAFADCDGAPARVQVTVYVGPAGEVKSAGFAVDGDVTLDETWADCGLEKALAVRLTDPRGQIWKLKGWYVP